MFGDTLIGGGGGGPAPGGFLTLTVVVPPRLSVTRIVASEHGSAWLVAVTVNLPGWSDEVAVTLMLESELTAL